MKKLRTNEEAAHSYWQSVTDALAGLLLVLLLILMLFMVRILYFTSNEQPGDTDYDNAGDHDYAEGYDYDHPENDHTGWEHSAGGGGGGEGYEIIPEFTSDAEPIEVGTAAVLVRLVDADTESPIPQAEVRFELRSDKGEALQLKTYYPVITAYRYFHTREDGTFYVPEKLPLGSFSLKNLSPAEGYELAADVDFTIDEDHDWPDPLVITAYVGAEKNVIAIQLVDAAGQPVAVAGSFPVFAAEDIITPDGTVRVSAGQQVDTIRTDASGAGASIELYLGTYRIQTRFENDFYVGSDSHLITLSSKNSREGQQTNLIPCEKTAIALLLVDELHTYKPLAGAEYRLRNTLTNESRTAVTDALGKLEFTDLAKDTLYELSQTGPLPYYCGISEPLQIYVDAAGCIDGQGRTELLLTNRKTRVTLQLLDAYLRRPISDASVTLLDESGSPVLSYISSTETKLIEGLAPGTYTLEIPDQGLRLPLIVADTAAEQTFTLPVKRTGSLILLVAALTGAAAAIAIPLIIQAKRRKKK